MNPVEKLLTITDEISDREAAALIATKIVFYAKTEVYRYSINHDIRPPTCMPCPVPYDWTVKNRVGVEFNSRHLAERWLTLALIHGYEVEEVDGHRKPTGSRTESVKRARERADYARRPKLEIDDDIPF